MLTTILAKRSCKLPRDALFIFLLTDFRLVIAAFKFTEEDTALLTDLQ